MAISASAPNPRLSNFRLSTWPSIPNIGNVGGGAPLLPRLGFPPLEPTAPGAGNCPPDATGRSIGSVGLVDGFAVGLVDGFTVGLIDGFTVGLTDGCCGDSTGFDDGLTSGFTGSGCSIGCGVAIGCGAGSTADGLGDGKALVGFATIVV
jgi:hypothetical protein